MSDGALPLQKALVARLKADAAVSAIVGGRVYDVVPANATLPYLSFGPFQQVPVRADQYRGYVTSVQIDGWSAGQNLGSVQAKRLVAAVEDALDQAELSLDENQRLVLLQIEAVRVLTDVDGIKQHAIITLSAHTEPTD
jgi:hypothetical protein